MEEPSISTLSKEVNSLKLEMQNMSSEWHSRWKEVEEKLQQLEKKFNNLQHQQENQTTDTDNLKKLTKEVSKLTYGNVFNSLHLKADFATAVSVFHEDLLRLNILAYKWKIKNNEWQMDSTLACISEPFSLLVYDFGAQIQLQIGKDDQVNLYFKWKNLQQRNSQSIEHKINTTSVIPKLICILKDQNSNRQLDVIRYCDYSFTSPLEYNYSQGPWPLLRHQQITSEPYSKHATIEIEVLVQPVNTARTCKGEYDKLLDSRLSHRLTAIVYNQQNEKYNLTKYSENDVLNGHYMEICDQSYIETKGFLVDNTLFFTFIIEAL
ncbi:hypothetical protein CHUAL_002193 [Chamberlinius hualienensis]